MSQTSYQQQQQQQQPNDTSSEIFENVLKFAVIILMILVALPLIIPALVLAFMGGIVATKTFYWVTIRWWAAAVTAGILLVGGLYAAEAGLLAQWIRDGQAAAFFARRTGEWFADLWPTFWPYVIGNLAAGFLLVPAALSLRRRRTARQVQARRVPDVLTQERIEAARKRAADWSTARQMGVKVRMSTGQIVGRTKGGMSAPYAVGEDQAFGLVNRATIRTMHDRFYDLRRVRDWIDKSGRFVIMPRIASAVRVLLIAESGTGKTVFLTDAIQCALKYGWPVFFIDAKGDPADAAALVAQARAAGRTAVAAGRWNMFGGTSDQVTEKLMRLMPPPDGANQHYLDEVRGILGMVQAHSPIRSAEDLRARLLAPEPHVRDTYDLRVIGAVVDSRTGQTAAERVLHALSTAIRPLENWIDADGWSYDNPAAEVTVMPLSPVDSTQARLGDLLMVDLRHYMATRLARGDKSPVLVVVDEFPQLVTAESDPGDTASSLFETARSAGMGLILAAQSTAGLSNDEVRRARALSSGAALIIGRSKDPEDVVKYAGTVMRMEASGAAQGEELRSARAQHTYVIPPQDVREAWDGSFWLVQGGAIAPFRTMPPERVVAEAPASDELLLKAIATPAAEPPAEPVEVMKPDTPPVRTVAPAKASFTPPKRTRAKPSATEPPAQS